ncbi:MAG: tripartite tricarboxylate transporter substrate binding protein [Ruthenibacterium sp.]
MSKKIKLLARILSVVLSATLLLTGCAGGGTTSYPDKNKSVTIIVERAAGGGSDLSARAFAPLLEKELGIPVVVVNKTGGDGVVGLNETAAAKPDGYTLDFSADTVQAIHSVMYKDTKYTEDSWEYLATTNLTAYIMVVGKNSKYTSLEEIMEDAKANPGKVTLGTPSGIAEVISAIEVNAGTKFAQIVNDSGANNLASLAGGHVDVGLLTSQFYQQALDQGLKVVGITSPERMDLYSDVPTFIESGYDVNVIQDFILIMPKGAPDSVLTPLLAAIDKAGNSQEFKDSLAAINAIPDFRSGKEASTYILENIGRIKKGLEAWPGSSKK